ncbi:MAG: hypothetical protein K2K00_05160 [Muribaculaceae bacterium]|nr:hypothetical protein [Muribaculaceae bacterium]MDE6703046.1 hypothetical protein [Muribaculaceae bacterium]
MKQLFYLSALGLAMAAIASCDNDPTNPGDFNVKSELEIAQLRSRVTGESYPLTVARSIDSTYRYSYNVYDTLKDASGEAILDKDGKLQITTTVDYYFSHITAKYVEFERITLPSYVDVELDTFDLEVNSNAKWLAPKIKEDVNWYNVISTTTGGGDGTLSFTIKQFSGTTSKNIVNQIMLTADSALMYRIQLGHTGLKYTGE